MKDNRAMSYCEDGDPYPSELDGENLFNLTVWLAVKVSQTGD
jgi:hypothetical protein